MQGALTKNAKLGQRGSWRCRLT